MKNIIVIITIFSLNGCGVIPCIDAQFERDIKPIDKVFNVELNFNDKVFKKTVKCEKYYSALCATRGNY